MKNFNLLLNELDACRSATTWALDKKIEEVVNTCHRGDWLLWLAKRIDIPLKPITLAKIRCAQTVIHLMKDQRSLTALVVAEKFALTDDVSLEDLNKARRNAAAAATAAATAAAAAYAAAAYAAAADAAAYAAADAAAYAAADTATAYAAAATAAVAYAADAAAYAAADDAAAAAAAAYAAARAKNQLQTADICREILGKMIIEKVNEMLTT